MFKEASDLARALNERSFLWSVYCLGDVVWRNVQFTDAANRQITAPAEPTFDDAGVHNLRNIINEAKHALDELAKMEKLGKTIRGGAIPAGDLYMMRSVGIHLLEGITDSVEQRLGAHISLYDKRVDVTHGLPKLMYMMCNSTIKRDASFQSRTVWKLQRLERLPIECYARGPGWPYVLECILGWDTRMQHRLRFHMTIAVDGQISIAATATNDTVVIRHARGQSFGNSRHSERSSYFSQRGFKVFDKFPSETWKKATVASFVSALVDIFQSQFLFPIITAVDHIGRSVRLSATESELKDIFHDRHRDGTGKKRPLMHWVRSHNRTGSKPVRTHLRGDTEFQLDGISFHIAMPGKPRKGSSAAAAKKLYSDELAQSLSASYERVTSNAALAILLGHTCRYASPQERKTETLKEIGAPIAAESVRRREFGPETYYSGETREAA